jgi:uncharacterized protein YggT (Ycf19 family)
MLSLSLLMMAKIRPEIGQSSTPMASMIIARPDVKLVRRAFPKLGSLDLAVMVLVNAIRRQQRSFHQPCTPGRAAIRSTVAIPGVAGNMIPIAFQNAEMFDNRAEPASDISPACTVFDRTPGGWPSSQPT